jgi:hypothetical protein
VREWLNRAVSKTVVPLRVPWVRIPPSPPAPKDANTRVFTMYATGPDGKEVPAMKISYTRKP